MNQTEENEFHPAFDTFCETVWDDLQLFRVHLNAHFELIAAHSWMQARTELARVWPEKTKRGAVIWSHAGPAKEYNLKGWKEQILNPKVGGVV